MGRCRADCRRVRQLCRHERRRNNVRAFLSRWSADRRRVSSGMGITRLAPGPALSLSGILNVDWQDFGARSKLALKGYPSQDGQEAGCHVPSKRTPQREENQPMGWAWNM